MRRTLQNWELSLPRFSPLAKHHRPAIASLATITNGWNGARLLPVRSSGRGLSKLTPSRGADAIQTHAGSAKAAVKAASASLSG